MILSVVNHVRQLVGIVAETLVLVPVETYVRGVPLYAIHRVKRNARMQLDILV